MLPEGRLGRLVVSLGTVGLASVLSVLSARGFQKPVAESAPAYRETGAPGAPVVIVEFSDFQCPHCRYTEEPLKKILSLYGADVRFIFKHFPLERAHPWARPAAVAAECAGRQGRFWPYHDLLYERQEEWSRAEDPSGSFLVYAAKAGLDVSAFSACLKDPATGSAITADQTEGNDRWVVSTPTFFINGRRFVGAQQLSGRGTVWIDKLLRRPGGRG